MDNQLSNQNVIQKLAKPNGGWVKAVREAISMSQKELGKRLSISQVAIDKLEDREIDGGVTIARLSAAAEAMNCDLVYGIIPKDGTFEELVHNQAQKVADSEIERISQTMKLEDQEITDSKSASTIIGYKSRGIVDSKRLWDL